MVIQSFENDVFVKYNTNPSLGEKIFGYFFSIIFHPLFIPVYVVWFLLHIHPTAFLGFSPENKSRVLLIIILNIVFFPIVTVLLLRKVGFINSILLNTRKDRIIPYIACGIFFFWAYNVFREQPQYSSLITTFLLGIFLASSAGLIANIYFKVSMHAIGMGGWLGFFLLLFINNSMIITWPLALVILFTGIVCSARLMISSHKPSDLVGGLLIGIATQFIASIFL